MALDIVKPPSECEEGRGGAYREQKREIVPSLQGRANEAVPEDYG